MFKRRCFVNKRIKILVFLLIWILCISIGYAYLVNALTVNGTVETTSSSWKVYFTNLQIVRGSATATTPPSVSGTNTTSITYSVNLSKPGDYYIFYVDVTNAGTIDAMLNELNITNLTTAQKKYLNYSVTYSDGTAINNKDKLRSGQSLKLKVALNFKQDLENSDLPSSIQTVPLSLSMRYVQAEDDAVPKNLKAVRKVTNSDIGKYIDLGKNVIGDAATTDDWRVLWVDETNNKTYLILSDFLPASQMPSATGITNNGSYNVYSTVDRPTLLTYMISDSRWSNLIDSSIAGATVKGGPTKEVVEASYTAKYGGSWTKTTARADTLLVPHNAEWNSCRGYWWVSPGTGSAAGVWRVDYNGDIYDHNWNSTLLGVRPVVCLSSDILLNVVGEKLVTNADIGKYVDLGKDVIGDTATTDDWRVLWVDETENKTYLILADFLPVSKMPTATGITNNGSYSVYANDNRDQLLNYMLTSSNWSSLIGSNITGVTVTGGPTKEVVEASYQAKYGGSWTNATAKSDTLLVSHNAEWNSCNGYWLASPYEGTATAMWFVGYTGTINIHNYYAINYGLRPVVCLSSDIPLVVVE